MTDYTVNEMIESVTPTTRAKRVPEQENIAPQPFPRVHLFLVTPDGVPVGELKFDPLDTRDGRFADAVLDVDRFTERMSHMSRAELNGLQNRLSGIQGRVQEFLNRPNTENGNGNGNGVHADAKPSVPPSPPSEPVAPAAMQAEPVTAPATPATPVTVPASAATPTTRRRRNAGTPRRTPAAQRAAGEQLAASLQQEAESEMLAQAASGSLAPTLTTTPAAAAPRMGGLVTLFGDDETTRQTTPAPAVPVPLPAPAATPAPTPTTAGATGSPTTAPPSAPARGSSNAATTSPSTAPTATPPTTPTPAPANAPAPAPNAPAPANPQVALEDKILRAAENNAPLGVSFGQIRDRVGCTTTEVFPALKRLLDAGKLRKEGTLYRLP